MSAYSDMSTADLKRLLREKKQRLAEIRPQVRELSNRVADAPEAARALIRLLFEKFPNGGDWLKNIQKVGRETCRAVSPIGRVRHLWGYLHHDRRVHNAMDRRGPNSVIQGMSSDEGFAGGRNLQEMIWDMLVSQGQPFSLRQGNSVHDSTEAIASAVDIPLSCYLMEHAYTSQIHRLYREVYGVRFTVDLQMEMDIGSSLATVKGWDYQPDTQLKLIQEGLEWNNRELNHGLELAPIMRKVEHNIEVISKMRRKELRRDLRDEPAASELMLINRDNVLDLGLHFARKFREAT